MKDDDECGAVGGMARETEVLGENSAPVPLCPPQIPQSSGDLDFTTGLIKIFLYIVNHGDQQSAVAPSLLTNRSRGEASR
jgi:hypothetical protein